jgi:mevalonate kinase
MEKEGFKALSVVSSPGKVIICGEHAVVYGEDALAMAISLRCSATVSAKESKDLQKPIITFAGSLSCEVNVSTLEEDTQEGFK